MKASDTVLGFWVFYQCWINCSIVCHLMKSTRFKTRTDQISWFMNSKSSQAVVANLMFVKREGF